jgi:hypothetical protein
MSASGAILHYALRPAHPQPALLDACLLRLPAARRAVLAARPVEQRVDSLLGIALAQAGAQALGAVRDVASLEFPADGRPAWAGGPGFSIAHAAGLVVCAFGAGDDATGVDVEATHAVSASDLRLVTDADERALLDARVLTPAALWTRKEAALKWAGLGLRHAASPRVGSDAVTLAGTRLQAVTVALQGGCVASLVAAVALEPVAVARHDALVLLQALATMPR